jgi:hypothetical protein
MNQRTRKEVRKHTLGTAQRGVRVSNRLVRTPLPVMILKVAAWIAYPWFFALVKVSRCLDNLCG